jgi:hypothetical protein
MDDILAMQNHAKLYVIPACCQPESIQFSSLDPGLKHAGVTTCGRLALIRNNNENNFTLGLPG